MHFSVDGAQIAVGLNEELRKERLRLIHLAWAAMASAILMARGPPTPCMPGVRIRGAAHQRGRGKTPAQFIRGEPQQADRRGDRRCQARGGRSDDRAPFPGRRITLGADKGYDATAGRLIFFRRERSNQAIY